MKYPLCMVILLGASLHAAEMDAKSIIQRSVEANQRDWKAAPEYSFSEEDREYDGAKKYEVSMILGSPYRRLVSVDGKPLSPEDQRSERRRWKRALARRRAESSGERAERTAKYEKDRKRDQSMMDQLTIAFDFQLVGEEKAGSYEAYVLQATPKRGYRPPNTATEVLPGMRGKLWIDKASFQWVKVEAEVVHPVSIAGFLARVEKGTRFELEKAPVADGVWLPSHFAMAARAKILNLVTHKEKEDQTFSGYHKADATNAGDLY